MYVCASGRPGGNERPGGAPPSAGRRRVATAAATIADAPTRLALLTLDLDDTFWPTAEVVADANEALAAALEKEGADIADLSPTMKRLRRAAGPEMSYTRARTDAIAVLLEEAGSDASKAPALFDVWLDARHAAAEARLFEGGAAAVAEVRRRHPAAVVAAVTNGRGDPARTPSLAPSFDFTVSGEDADARRPCGNLARRS